MRRAAVPFAAPALLSGLALLAGCSPRAPHAGGETARDSAAVRDSAAAIADTATTAWRFRARGNEPFWSVTVWRDSLVFRQPGEPARLEFASPTAIARGDTLWWVAESADPRHRLELQLIPGRCTDSMSGETATFAAVATLDGRRLAGCGFTGPAAFGALPQAAGAR